MKSLFDNNYTGESVYDAPVRRMKAKGGRGNAGNKNRCK